MKRKQIRLELNTTHNEGRDFKYGFIGKEMTLDGKYYNLTYFKYLFCIHDTIA